jgi:transcription initiation factor IIE alpha subunit
MGMSDEAFEVSCPDCGAMLKIDPVTRAIIAHKNKDDLMAKKFAEAVKKAKQGPLTERPLRDFDLE